VATLTTCVLGSSDELRRGTRDVKRRHSSARRRRISWPAPPNIYVRRGVDASADDWTKHTNDIRWTVPVVITQRTDSAEHVAVLLGTHRQHHVSDYKERSMYPQTFIISAVKNLSHTAFKHHLRPADQVWHRLFDGPEGHVLVPLHNRKQQLIPCDPRLGVATATA
jgi:hypothetical protein